MSSRDPHGSCAACDCVVVAPNQAAGASSTAWSALLAVVVCAVCPACLATYTKLLSLLGVSLGFDEALHHVLMASALVASMAVSARRSWRTRRAWPFVAAACGSALVALGHLLGELHALEWAGVLVLLVGGWCEQYRPRALTG